MSDLYEFKMSLFDNGDPEELSLSISNFQITLEASEMLAAGAKIQYLCTLVQGKALHQTAVLSVGVRVTTSEHRKSIMLGLGTYFFLVNALSKQRPVILHRMRNPRGLKVRRCAAHIIDLNKYFAVFPGENSSENICDMELDEILLKSMPNRCRRQAYV